MKQQVTPIHDPHSWNHLSPHDGHRQAKKENSTITAEALVAGYMDLHLEKGRVFGWLTLSLACLAGKRHFSLVMLRWTCGMYDIVGWSRRAKLKMALGHIGTPSPSRVQLSRPNHPSYEFLELVPWQPGLIGQEEVVKMTVSWSALQNNAVKPSIAVNGWKNHKIP